MQNNLDLNQYFQNGFTFTQYIQIVEKLVQEEKTSGPNQSEAMAHYTKLSWQRMKRWNKRYTLEPEFFDLLQSLKIKQIKALVITEAWCGDAAHLLPLFNIICRVASIPFKCAWRDENPELINAFLTNGGKSIPIFILFNEKNEVIFRYGPRPKPMQKRVLHYKEKKDKPYEEFLQETQVWYNQDKGKTPQEELEPLFLKLV